MTTVILFSPFFSRVVRPHCNLSSRKFILIFGLKGHVHRLLISNEEVFDPPLYIIPIF
jgi:hypothetical protein